jgi:hypothetical protein
MKKLIASIAGAVASYYTMRYINGLLQYKPLKTRVREAKSSVSDLKDQVTSKITNVKDAAAKHVNSLIEEKDHSHQENDA